MNLGELFVKLKIAGDPKNAEQMNKFKQGLVSLKDQANDFRKQANEIIKSKFSNFFKESEFASLGFLGKLTDIVGKANMVRLAILGVVAAMVKLTQNAAEASEHLFKFSLNTGLSTTNLQKWQMQAEQVGVSADEVSNSFAALQQKAMDIQLGQGDARAFQLSGVSWFADAETQLGQIEKMLATRPAALGTKLAMDMGLSEDMITFLRMRSQLKPADPGLILSPDEIRDLKDFSIDFKATLAAFQNAMRKIGALILPVTRPLMNLANRLMRVGVEISKWVSESKRFQMVLVGLGIAAGLLAIKLFPVTAVVLAISAAIGAALLIIDDVATFIRGGDSVTGLLWEGLKTGFKTVISEIKKDWTVLIDWFVEGIGKLVDIIVSPILKVLELIGVLQNVDYQGAQKALTSGWQSVKEIDGSTFTGLWDKIGDFFSPIAPAISGGPMLPAGASSVNQSVQINVNGAREPAAVANEINKVLKKQTSDAVYQMPRQEQ